MNLSDRSRVEKALELNNIGLAQYKNVDFDDAIATYSKALAMCPNLAVVYYNRGTVHYRIGDLDLALADLKRAVHLDPKNDEFREGLNECQRLMKEKNSVKNGH